MATYQELCTSLAETLRHLKKMGYNVGENHHAKKSRHLNLMATAATMGHSECIEFFGQLGIYANKCTEFEDSPICLAAQEGHAECIKLLHQFGANVNESGNYGLYPIELAACRGHTECIRVLHHMGADMNTSSSSSVDDFCGMTPVHFCAGKGRGIDTVDEETMINNLGSRKHMECLKAFYELGADMHKCDDMGRSAVHWAVSSGDIECVKLLYDLGVDIHRCDSRGRSAVHYAVKYSRIDCIKILHDLGVDIHKCDNKGVSTFLLSAKYSSANCIMLLHDLGVDIHKCDNKGVSPAHYAAKLGSTDSIKLLHELGVSIHICDNNGMSAAHHAADSYRGDNMIQVLHDLGADIHRCDSNGMSTFHYAAKWGDKNCIKLLFDLEVDINKRDKKGLTPVHYAVGDGRYYSLMSNRCISILSELGANIDLCDVKGNTPLMLALKKPLFMKAEISLAVATLIKLGAQLPLCREKTHQAGLVRRVIAFTKLSSVYMKNHNPNDEDNHRLSSLIQRNISLELLGTISEEQVRPFAVLVFEIARELQASILKEEADNHIEMLPKLLNVLLNRDVLNLRIACSTTQRCAFPAPHKPHLELPAGLIESYLGTHCTAHIPIKYLKRALAMQS